MCWSRTSFPGQALPHRPMPILPLSDWTGPRTCTALHPPHPGVHLDPPSCQARALCCPMVVGGQWLKGLTWQRCGWWGQRPGLYLLDSPSKSPESPVLLSGPL
jgi:hypothetical protein